MHLSWEPVRSVEWCPVALPQDSSCEKGSLLSCPLVQCCHWSPHQSQGMEGLQLLLWGLNWHWELAVQMPTTLVVLPLPPCTGHHLPQVPMCSGNREAAMGLIDPSPQRLQTTGTWGWDDGLGPQLSEPGPVCAGQRRVTQARERCGYDWLGLTQALAPP